MIERQVAERACNFCRTWLLVLLWVVGYTPGSPAQDVAHAEIKQRVEQLREVGSLRLAGRTVRASSPLAALYETRSFAPIWGSSSAATDLLAAIRSSAADGLEPSDYHLSVLVAAPSRLADPAAAADLDLLRTDALLRLLHDTRHGKVEPGAYASVERDPGRVAAELIAEVTRIIESGRVSGNVAALRPNHFVYRGLMQALAELRRIESTGGWDRIPPGPALLLSSVDPRVPELRRRLAVSGDLVSRQLATDSVFDRELETALKRFQHRHGLNEDGVLGPATLAELNLPVSDRIAQIRVNLERARWVTHDLPSRFVVVNIAGAMVYLVRNSEVVFESRVIVGKTYTRTPIFRATMRYVDLNPTWTVPPGIVGEVLAEIRRDASYLRHMNMRVIDRSGRPLELTAGELRRYTGSTFPYVFRQEPGPSNPLGQVKLVFPNPYHVYLHDTPAKQLFDREARLFSHGCIRVRDPVRLAELVLDDPVRWNRETLTAALDTGRTRTIMLAEPLPVLVLYWTASADLHGELHFYRDVYGRDAAVLQGLERR